MIKLPETLEEATAQAVLATKQALDAGCLRLQIDMKFPEIAQMPIALEFAEFFNQKYDQNWQALFADAGTAALAKRDWADSDILRNISMRGVNEGRAAVRPESQAFLLVSPTSVEVDGIEKILTLVDDRPFVMLNPKLENSEVGLGLAARRMRDRFLSIFEISYYIQPQDWELGQGAVWRCYPQMWQVWQERTEEKSDQNPDQNPDQNLETSTKLISAMKLIYEGQEKPVGDELDRILAKATGKKTSIFGQLQQFINALSR